MLFELTLGSVCNYIYFETSDQLFLKQHRKPLESWYLPLDQRFLQEAKRTASFIKSNQPTECEYKTLTQVKHF